MFMYFHLCVLVFNRIHVVAFNVAGRGDPANVAESTQSLGESSTPSVCLFVLPTSRTTICFFFKDHSDYKYIFLFVCLPRTVNKLVIVHIVLVCLCFYSAQSFFEHISNLFYSMFVSDQPQRIFELPTSSERTNLTAVITWVHPGGVVRTFTLQYKLRLGNWNVAANVTIPGNETSVLLTDLIPDSQYDVRVRTNNALGESKFSFAATFITLGELWLALNVYQCCYCKYCMPCSLVSTHHCWTGDGECRRESGY